MGAGVAGVVVVGGAEGLAGEVGRPTGLLSLLAQAESVPAARRAAVIKLRGRAMRDVIVFSRVT
ncbi:hypothetical protein GCM10022198_21650 [Klugiella xanthotipulae]